MDLTQITNRLARQQYNRGREMTIATLSFVDPDQFPLWDDLDVPTQMTFAEDALEDIETMLPYLEEAVLSDLANDDRFQVEASILLGDLAINKALELMTGDM